MNTQTHPTVAVLGMGIMGRQMATRIASAGFPTRIWNRTVRDVGLVVSSGAHIAHTIADAVNGAAIIVVMVSTGGAVDEILFGPDGIAIHACPGSSVIVMSSIAPEAIRRQAGRLRQQNIICLDAPVSGGEIGARNGDLSIMAGGDPHELSAVLPLLQTMGRVTHVGPVGSGQAAKLANQVIVGVTIAAVAEALLLAQSEGVASSALLAALSGGFADSTVLQVHGKRMIAEDFSPGARASTQLKDLRNAMSASLNAGIDLPVLRLVESLFASMCANGLSERDHSALYLWLQRQIT